MKNDFKSRLSLAFLWIFSFLIIIFIMCFTVHASSEQDYFPMFQNENNHFSEYDKTSIENRFDPVNNYIFAYFSGYQAGYGERMKVFHVLVVPKSSGIIIYGEKFNNLYQFSLYGGGGTLTNNMCYQYSILEQNWKYEYSDNLSSFQNLQSSNYNNSIDYVSNFQILTNNTSSAQVVLFYDDGVSIPDGDTARDDMDKPDIDDYIPSWNNKPSFDGSTVENALSSIWDITVWTAENTRDTIKGVGQFIGDTLRWTSQKIIDSIRGKIDELKTGIVNAINNLSAFLQDVKGFVSNIKDFVDYLTEPLDLTEVETSLNSSTTYSLVNAASTLKATYKDYFDSITAPSSLSFHIPYTILTKSGFIDFDFSWYADIRDSVLPWIVGFLYMGFGLALFRSFPSIIHGVSGILQKGG